MYFSHTCVIFLTFLNHVLSEKITDINEAKAWLQDYNSRLEEVSFNAVLASWNYNTNITDYNQQKAIDESLKSSLFAKEAAKNASLFAWEDFEDELVKREFMKISDIGMAVLPDEKISRSKLLRTELRKRYSTAKVCNEENCVLLYPDLTKLMAESRDWNELTWAWKGWRDASGKKMRDLYREYVDLNNEAADLNGYSDAGEYWRSNYEQDDFEQEVAKLWEETKPLYNQLHAYALRKLKTLYPDETFPESGHIPAHLLGDMWAQTWEAMISELKPFQDKGDVDVTDALIEQNYTTLRIFELSEDFFKSLDLEPMPASFWTDSMLEKPTDREVVCHASAWDFYNQKDFRIKQCTETDMNWLLTTHHEMGHIDYFLLYKSQPAAFRDGANPGFHEAVGDVMSLSVSTPEHLHLIGLLDQVEEDQETDLNFLMNQALKKVAFLPFGYLIDQWRWGVFRGDTKHNTYNEDWWKLRCGIQGISPPVMRSEDDFDPGSKFHIPGNTPYIRYFVSNMLQFQLHEALCETAGNQRPLHRCDIYGSKEAGRKLREMLELGSSVKWPEALKIVTGKGTLEAGSLLRYFQPLYDWLKKQNEGHPVGWDQSCPDGTIVVTSSSKILIPSVLTLILSLITYAIRD